MEPVIAVTIPTELGYYRFEKVWCIRLVNTKNKVRINNILKYSNVYNYGDTISCVKEEGEYYLEKKEESSKYKIYRSRTGISTEPELLKLLLLLKDYLKSSDFFIESWTISISKFRENREDKLDTGIAIINDIEVIKKVAEFARSNSIICPELMLDSGDEINYLRHRRLAA